MKVKVVDPMGRDVTFDRDWYISQYGVLMYLVSDVECPLVEADKGYSFYIVP